jgi:hypothetical protein
MSSPALFRFVFAIYCLEAGFFLVTAPWLAAWERFAWSLPWSALRQGALSGWGRGALVSFGLVHLVWAFHDIDLYLRRRNAPAVAPPPPAGRL